MKNRKNQYSIAPILVGGTLTAMVFGVAFVSASMPACFETTKGIINCPTKWFYLKQSTPNELGDTLAGFAGALAFIWIVVTVWIQSQELSAQREELADTREELSLTRKAQEEQLKVMEAQAKIFEDEQSERAEMRAKEVLEQRLDHLRNLITTDQTGWIYSENPGAIYGASAIARKLFNNDEQMENLSVDQFFFRQLDHVNNTLDDLLIDIEKSALDKSRYPAIVSLAQILSVFEGVFAILGRLGEDQFERIQKLELQSFKQQLDKYAELPIWAHSRGKQN